MLTHSYSSSSPPSDKSGELLPPLAHSTTGDASLVIGAILSSLLVATDGQIKQKESTLLLAATLPALKGLEPWLNLVAGSNADRFREALVRSLHKTCLLISEQYSKRETEGEGEGGLQLASIIGLLLSETAVWCDSLTQVGNKAKPMLTKVLLSISDLEIGVETLKCVIAMDRRRWRNDRSRVEVMEPIASSCVKISSSSSSESQITKALVSVLETSHLTTRYE